MSDYENMKLYELFWATRNEDLAKIDPYISKKITSIDDYLDNYYSFRSYQNSEKLPMLTKKLNEIVINYINESKEIKWLKINTLGHWATDELKSICTNIWLEGKNTRISYSWAYDYARNNNKLRIPVLKRLIELYNNNRSYPRVSAVYHMFHLVDDESLSEACKLLSNATPTITAGLLSRENIPEEYIIEGLKAISKIKTQKNVQIKIDLKTLECLGPRARLNAMKQLLGIIHRWSYTTDTELPFKNSPTKEDIREFLFPCSFKYNKEVSNLLDRLDVIMDSKR